MTLQGRESCPERDGTAATSRERAGIEKAGFGPSLGLHRRGPPNTAECSIRPDGAEAVPAEFHSSATRLTENGKESNQIQNYKARI